MFSGGGGGGGGGQLKWCGIGLGYGYGRNGDKPILKSMLSTISWYHMASLGHIELTQFYSDRCKTYGHWQRLKITLTSEVNEKHVLSFPTFE